MIPTEPAKERYWAVAQTVSNMEHIVRREIEKTHREAFLPTYARHWKIDDRAYAKEYPLVGGYVFFLTKPDDWAGIPDIHGVYRVLTKPNWEPSRVTDSEMTRLVLSHATGDHSRTDPPRYTKYYRRPTKKAARYRRPRPGKRIRNCTAA